MPNFNNIRNNFKVFELLKEIKGHTFKLTDRNYPYQSVLDSFLNVFVRKQGNDEFLDKFQERFNVAIEAAEGYGCEFGTEDKLWNTDILWNCLSDSEKLDPMNVKEVKESCCENCWYMASGIP